MWKLTIQDDQGNRIPVPLVRDDYALGRGPENTLRLTERNVSRKHAILERVGERWALVDLGSYNGSYVNGQRVVMRQELAHGDLIQLADYRIEVAEEAELEPAALGFEEEAGPAESEPVIPAALPWASEEPASGSEPVVDSARQLDESFARPAFDPGALEPDTFEIPKQRSKWLGVVVGALIAAGVGGGALVMLRSEPDANRASQLVAERAALPPEAKPAESPSKPVEPSPEPARDPQPSERAAVAQPVIEAEPVAPSEPVLQAKVEAPPAPAPAPTTQALAARVAPEPKPSAPAPETKPAAPARQDERRPVLAKNPFDPPSSSERAAPAAPAEKPASGKLSELAAQGREGEGKMRGILEQRVASGRASTDDIKLLRAICKNMGDRVCVDRMNALLEKRK